MSNCSECLELSFETCSDLTFDVGISDGSYFVWIYDKFGNVYKKAITVLSNSFTLYITDFPEGLFTGTGFLLYISESETTNTQEDFTFGYDSYNCAIFNMYDVVSGSTSAASPACLDNYESLTAPTVNDDRTLGYCKGSEWLDNSPVSPAPRVLYKCTDSTDGAAVWVIIQYV